MLYTILFILFLCLYVNLKKKIYFENTKNKIEKKSVNSKRNYERDRQREKEYLVFFVLYKW